ncbi:MAG: S8 family serine peptidase [Saprospiraceae bacterium]|nr:S8 family serine peptidase [Saprospiraceae bacterium]
MKFLKNILLISLFSSLYMSISAQSSVPENWFNLDPEQDNINGVSTERTYEELLKGKSATPVIVAVIDGGVDPQHEDLKDVMWQNPGEVPGNGIDDDKNGYTDDIYGWNFIGGKDGQNVHHDTYELTRIVGEMEKKFADTNPASLSGKEKDEYAKYLTYKKDVDQELEKANAQVAQYDQILTYVNFAIKMAREAIGDEPITQETIDNLDDTKYGMVKSFFDQLLPQMGEFDGNLDDLEELIVKDLQEALDHEKNKVDYGYNTKYNSRTIVKDNYGNKSERIYGNPDVKGPDAFHGTHVAGIIAANRKNDLGIKGVANNVRIMAVRAVPDGDERDKDVANAIRYAVDNGADIINMSFGKGFSPEEIEVEKAIKYAEKKDVLLVHASGNDGQDNDKENNYPNATYDKKRGLFGKKRASNWIEVGALNWRGGEDMVAGFSNYGRKNVDVFAPGQEIYSTAPDGAYQEASGTSMASPVVAGVAAVLKSYFPTLKAKQIKDILTQSSRPYLGKVRKPGTGELVPFKSLSTSGGAVNLKSAVMQALITTGNATGAGNQKTKGRA